MKQYRCGLIARDIHNSITPSVYEVYARDIGMEIDFRFSTLNRSS